MRGWLKNLTCLRESLAFGVPRPREGHGQRRRGGDTFGRFARKACVRSPASTRGSRSTTARMRHLRQVCAKVLRSAIRVHARVTGNGAVEKPDMSPRKSCGRSLASTRGSRSTTARMRHLRQVSAKVLRSAIRVHARVTVNDGAGETPSAGLRERLAFGVPRPREGHGQRRCG